MGDSFQTVADLDATDDEAPVLGASIAAWLEASGIVLPEQLDRFGVERHRPPGPSWSRAVAGPGDDPMFLDLAWNGLVVEAAHKVFGLGQVEGLIRCPSCAFEIDPEVWGEAASEWFDRSGPALV